MRRAVRRLVLVAAVAGLSAAAGSLLFAAPALAGGVNTNPFDSNYGLYSAGVYNFTPYQWTLVADATPEWSNGSPCRQDFGLDQTCWEAPPASTIAPGKEMIYELAPNSSSTGFLGCCQMFGYDGWMTYRVDVVGGPPEFVTIAVSQAWQEGGVHEPSLAQFITTAKPCACFDPGPNPNAPPAPGTVIASPQLVFQEGSPFAYDLTYTVTGNYTVDASTDQGAPFVSLLNSVCGANANACSFTQTSLTWGIGKPGSKRTAVNCTTVPGGAGPASAGVGDEPPPDQDPDWFEVEYAASQSASLSVGAGVSVSAETNLFGVISAKISVKLEAEGEWKETKTFRRSTRVYIPSNSIASLWVAPVIGTVKGTLVVSVGPATFTATNFTETRSGVTKNDLTPAFDELTKVRPLTAAEYQADCASSSATGLGSTKRRGSLSARPPARLVPGRGVAGVGLGQTQAQVLGALGRPSVKRFALSPCRGLGAGCYAKAGVGGSWSYRRLTVVFGPDLRVSGLIYRGSRHSAKRVGVGSALSVVRRAYPRASCTAPGKSRSCRLSGTLAGRAVSTVFGLVRTRAGRYRCDRVSIFVLAAGRARVKA